MGLWVLGFGLAQPWLSGSFGDSTNDRFSLSSKYINKQTKIQFISTLVWASKKIVKNIESEQCKNIYIMYICVCIYKYISYIIIYIHII